MKSYKISALRRRFYKELPDVAFCSLLVIATMTTLIIATNKPASAQVRPQHTVRNVVVEKIALRPQTEESYIKSLPYGDLVWKTYGHESTWGKSDSCRAQGLFNGFGYAYQCFSSVNEVAQKVSNWFANQLKTMTVKQALCYYNTGKIKDDCEYAEYTLAL